MSYTKPPLKQGRWLALFVIFALVLLLIFILAYNQLIPAQLASLPFYDKAGHFFLLGIAGYLAHRAAGRRHLTLGPLSIPIGPVIVALAAAAEEGAQILSPYRTLSIMDLAADLCGIVSFYAVDQWLARRGQTFAVSPSRHVP